MNTFLGISASILFSIVTILQINAQKPISELKWPFVANGMPEDWYGSEESKNVAENVLLYQRNIGGWPKNTAFHLPLSEIEKIEILKQKNDKDAIFDNGATTTEIRFLAKMFLKTGNKQYNEAVLKGLDFALKAQYENGGWPMFYPLRKGYYTHITFNDDAHFRLMRLLEDVSTQKEPFGFIADQKLVSACKNAWDKGINCILKTQIVVNGKPTVWCAQHNEVTFEPAKARAYELPSFSGSESVGLLEILMSIQEPSPEIIKAVQGGIEWLQTHSIKGFKIETFTNEQGKPDRRLVATPNDNSLWARFYDLETGLPFFCDRDGIKKNSLSEIGYERRNGYSWYTDKPQKILDKYPAWKSKWVKI
jgi:pectinesterase